MSAVNAELDVMREELQRARSGGRREASSVLASNPTETVQSVQDAAVPLVHILSSTPPKITWS